MFKHNLMNKRLDFLYDEEPILENLIVGYMTFFKRYHFFNFKKFDNSL